MRKAKVCPRCGSVFMHRGNLNTHLKKKSECQTKYIKVKRADVIGDYDKYYKMYLELLDIEDVDNEYKTKKQKLKTYKLIPKNVEKQNDNIKNVLQQYLDNVDEDMIQNMTEDIMGVVKNENVPVQNVTNKIDNSRNTNHNNFMQNSHNKQLNQQFNITVNAYGQEDLSHISQKDWIKIIRKKLDAIPELTKKIYIDEETNRNIYIKSFKDGFGFKFNGDDWIPVRMDKLITDLLVTNTDRLYDYLESEDNDINSYLHQSANDVIDKLSEEKSSLAKRNKMDIKELLVENSHIIKNTSGI